MLHRPGFPPRFLTDVHLRLAFLRCSFLMDGWRNDPKTDKENKLHADRIPYNLLPDATKDYDRSAAKEMREYLERNGEMVVQRETGQNPEFKIT